MTVPTVVQRLDKWFRKPQARLPQRLRQFVVKLIPEWDGLSESERRQAAERIDRQHAVKMRIKLDRATKAQQASAMDPKAQAYDLIAWFNFTLKAEEWLGYKHVIPYEAATLLCGQNPHAADLDLKKDSSDETCPADFHSLLRAFEDAALDGKPRSLRQWAEVAKALRLKHHTWLDRYEQALLTVEADGLTKANPEAGGVATAPLSSNERTDIEAKERGADHASPLGPDDHSASATINSIPIKMPRVAIRRLMVEAAQEIEKEIGRAASVTQVMERLKTWAEEGREPDILVGYNSQQRGVEWLTYEGEKKVFDRQTCRRAMADWRKSCQEQQGE